MFKKSVEIRARRAVPGEVIETGLDATKNTAEEGDWIVTNPNGEQYIVKDDKFQARYEPKEGEDGVFVSKGLPVKAVQVDRNIVFKAPWGELQAVKAGGYIIESGNERYGIDQDAFLKTYKPVEEVE